MAYTITNFKTKKALKEAVMAYEASNKDRYAPAHEIDRNKVCCYNPGHGYPASTETVIEYKSFTAIGEWEKEVEALMIRGTSFRAIRAEVAKVSVKVGIE